MTKKATQFTGVMSHLVGDRWEPRTGDKQSGDSINTNCPACLWRTKKAARVAEVMATPDSDHWKLCTGEENIVSGDIIKTHVGAYCYS